MTLSPWMNPWNEERDAQLTELWASGISASAIGERMGTSRNAAIGRVHRLGLPARKEANKQLRPDTSASLWSVANDAKLIELWASGASGESIGRTLGCSSNAVFGRVHRLDLPRRQASTKRSPAAAKAALAAGLKAGGQKPGCAAPRSATPSTVVYALSARECQYIAGDPRDMQFCCGPAVQGKSYCPEHHALCWRPVVRADSGARWWA